MRLNFRRLAQRTVPITSFSLVLLFCVTASRTMGQDTAGTVSHEVPEQTSTFSTVNPYTKAPGSMTITFSGVFGITQPTEPTDLGMFRVTGRQSGTFSFIPDDPSQPTISGTFRFRLAGNAKTDIDTIDFAFIMLGRAQDGSIFRFIQHERAVVGQEGLNISFGKTDGVGMPRDN